MPSVEQISLGEWLAEEPYTLACSSGFFGFYAQSGVISVLHEEGLAPAATRGSSTGALATAMWAAEGFDYSQISKVLTGIKRGDFWDPEIGLGLLRGEHAEDLLRETLSDKSFEDCKVPVHISVFDLKSRQTEVLDSGDLTKAVHASISFPGLFQPVIISGRPKLDGGIKDHAAVHDAPKEERILHQNLRPNRYDIADRGYTNSQTLVLYDLPFVHPFRLGKGIEAFNLAREQTRVRLDRPVRAA
jgi:NTE family protein